MWKKILLPLINIFFRQNDPVKNERKYFDNSLPEYHFYSYIKVKIYILNSDLV